MQGHGRVMRRVQRRGSKLEERSVQVQPVWGRSLQVTLGRCLWALVSLLCWAGSEEASGVLSSGEAPFGL